MIFGTGGGATGTTTYATITSATTTNQTVGSIYASTSATGLYGQGVLVAARPANLDFSQLKIPDGRAARIELPDKSIIDVKSDGSYTIEDKNAQVIYRAARVRDFNRFVNASDQLEAFIRFCGQQGVKQDEMMKMPIELFIGWLIVEAAKADRELIVPALPDLRPKKPRCLSCGRFISLLKKSSRIEFCAGACLDRRIACI